MSNSAIVDGIIKQINYPALNWSHIEKLKEKTSLPILLKGVYIQMTRFGRSIVVWKG